jgi:hypothetical protein
MHFSLFFSFSGFHIKIKHSGTLKLETITTKLKSIVPPPSQRDSQVEYFASRYAPKNAHVIIKPPKDGQDIGVNILGQIVAFIKSRKFSIYYLKQKVCVVIKLSRAE